MPEHKNGKKNTKMIFNGFGNISPENKDSKVAFIRKICLIKLFLSILLKSSENIEF